MSDEEWVTLEELLGTGILFPGETIIYNNISGISIF